MNIIEDNNDTLRDNAQKGKTHSRNVTIQVVRDNILTGDFFDKGNNAQSSTDYATLGDNVLNDLEVLSSYSSDTTNNNVIDSLGNRYMCGTRVYLENIVSHPLKSIERLKSRQGVLKQLQEVFAKNKESVHASFKILQDSEEDICWLFSESQNELSSLYDMVYINYWLLGSLNKNDHLLTSYNLYRIIGSPIIGIVSPIMYFVVPYLVLRYKLGLKIQFFDYIKMLFKSFFSGSDIFMPSGLSKIKYISYGFTLLFYFQSLFNSVEVSKAVYKLSNLLTDRVNGIVSYIKHSYKLYNECWTDALLEAFDYKLSNMPNNIPYFQDESLKPFSIFRNFGKQLSIFKFLKKEMYVPLLQRSYLLDALHTVVTLVSSDKQSPFTFSFADFKEPSLVGGLVAKPRVDLKGFYHPCLDCSTIVTNDLTLGSEKPQNIILTGPNAGGKSTLIKSFIISILLSQTFTISNAYNSSLTPFGQINTQINIPDCKGKQSLFEAEMYRSKHNFDVLKAMPNNEFYLIAMDEIFSSTNPIEGIAGAYAIAKKLAEYPNVICIISTHYVYLTKLASEHRDLFCKYKMNVLLDESGNVLSYPYKLFTGVSRQYIALELLRKNGFDDDIIEEALGIKNKLSICNEQKKQVDVNPDGKAVTIACKDEKAEDMAVQDSTVDIR
jgi:energy-coupling factor transporter ATP-binding protein EcfA2